MLLHIAMNLYCKGFIFSFTVIHIHSKNIIAGNHAITCVEQQSPVSCKVWVGDAACMYLGIALCLVQVWFELSLLVL